MLLQPVSCSIALHQRKDLLKRPLRDTACSCLGWFAIASPYGNRVFLRSLPGMNVYRRAALIKQIV